MSESKYSNVHDVAKFFDISEPTVRLWVKKGLIDRSCYVKADTTYRFDIPAIEKHLRGEVEETYEQLFAVSDVDEFTGITGIKSLDEDF